MVNRTVFLIFVLILLSACWQTIADACDQETKYYKPAINHYNPAFPLYPDTTITVEFTDLAGDLEKRRQLRNDILNLVEDRKAGTFCDCSFIEIGYNTCGGGIEEFVIFSESTVDVARLLRMASYYRAYVKLIDDHYNLMNTCIGIPLPKAALIKGECTPYFGN